MSLLYHKTLSAHLSSTRSADGVRLGSDPQTSGLPGAADAQAAAASPRAFPAQAAEGSVRCAPHEARLLDWGVDG